jgi:predicted DsbA family dithiol-disulfide isomerase
MENDNITGDMVEATEFPQLAQRYSVMGVPRSVINENTHIEGAVPEGVFITQLMEVINPEGSKMVNEVIPPKNKKRNKAKKK